MTKAVPSRVVRPCKFVVLYRAKDGWTRANNALGEPIYCDTEALAHAVGKARLRRINWRPR